MSAATELLGGREEVLRNGLEVCSGDFPLYMQMIVSASSFVENFKVVALSGLETDGYTLLLGIFAPLIGECIAVVVSDEAFAAFGIVAAEPELSAVIATDAEFVCSGDGCMNQAVDALAIAIA